MKEKSDKNKNTRLEKITSKVFWTDFNFWFTLPFIGLSDDDLLIGSSNRTSAEEMLTLLTREPPDGKEKPEPSKSSLLKMETLSRKSSKCDLLSSNSSSNSPQVRKFDF